MSQHKKKRIGLQAHIDPTGKILRVTADVEDLLTQDGEGYAALEPYPGGWKLTPIVAPTGALGIYRLRYQGRQMAMSGISQLGFHPGTRFRCRWDAEGLVGEI